ncbi:DnaJ domain-containing protein [Halolamina salifodinae]|uniref:Curved DNA-binding protein CbpA n=1 Tax=Halolamina salifodinae TaxID=1202767 RepID=A0A8T4GV33_9EURY|nr:DnaJ domain-containing protein [Halolamina salifodinae]MBP1986749.1 curved DNA-binding protein CbpA [Halolamina salifodinae]
MPADLYDVLGTSDDASAEEIKRAYRERVREYHPDVNDHPEGDAQFKLIRTANDVLSDPGQRKDYDRMGHREYVEKRLDDLPAVSVFPDEDLPDGTTTDTVSTTGTSTTATTGSSTSTTSTTRTTSGRSQSSRNGRSHTSQDSSGGTTDSGSSESGTSSTQTGSTSGGATSDTTTSDIGSQTTNEQTSTSGAERDSWDAAASARATTTESESTVPAGVRRRRGLKRWYGVVFVSLLAYLGGLGLYAYGRLGAVRGAISDITAAPVATLLGAFPLSSPTAYLLDAARAATAGTPAPGLLLLAGTVLLPLVVLTTVGRFGRGAAWMYALPSLAPAVCFGLWYVLAVPTWLALVGLIVLPILSGGGFLVDVGRYLRATR